MATQLRSYGHLPEDGYRRKNVLSALYKRDELPQSEIAEIFGVHKTTISKYIRRYGLDTYGPGWRGWFVLENCDGYPTFGADGRSVPIHHLVAVANGADPGKVFGNPEYSVDHSNGHKLDNRPENIQLLDASEHGRKDAERSPTSYTQSDLMAVIQFMLNPGEYSDSDSADL